MNQYFESYYDNGELCIPYQNDTMIDSTLIWILFFVEVLVGLFIISQQSDDYIIVLEQMHNGRNYRLYEEKKN